MNSRPRGVLAWSLAIAIGLVCWATPARSVALTNPLLVLVLVVLGFVCSISVTGSQNPTGSDRRWLIVAALASIVAVLSGMRLASQANLLDGLFTGGLPLAMSVAYSRLFGNRVRPPRLLTAGSAAIVPLVMLPLGAYLSLLATALITGEGP
jgi:hypothetical protein